jgi:4,5:9,10-diseco-3-hydroxy-5,9,17-trioxoandrosta-1(10),2-diene-4-oate hydrolase
MMPGEPAIGSLYNSFVNSKDMGRKADVGGPVVHYVDDGEGPPVLFLHGFGFSLFTFRRNLQWFAPKFRVIAPDLPGCGYSWLPGNYGATPAEMARYLKSLLDILEVKSAAVCGAGEGGVFALELALRFPDRVSALVLSSPGSLTRHFPRYLKQLATPLIGSLRIRAMGLGEMRDFLRWCYFSEIRVDNYIVRQVFRPFENMHARDVLLKLLREYDDRYVHEHLRSVRCPTLAVWGENDLGRPCGMAEIYKKAIPGAAACLIRNCGMLPHEEKHREFNEEMERFLADALPEYAQAAQAAALREAGPPEEPF